MTGTWRRIGSAQDVPLLEGRSVAVGDVRVAVFRRADGFSALAAICPHRGGPLADGILADSCVICPLHGWRIDLDTGRVVSADGEGAVATYVIEEQGGELYLLVSEVDGAPVERAAAATAAA